MATNSAGSAPGADQVIKTPADGSVRIGGPDGSLRFVPEDIGEWIDAARAAWHPGDSRSASLRRAAAVQR